MRDVNPAPAASAASGPTAPPASSRRRAAEPALGRAARTALVLAAVAWGGASASAEPGGDTSGLERAREQVAELRYDRALATLDRSIEAGTSGPAVTAQLYLLLGEVRASLGKDDEAESAFGRALAIDPQLELRKGVSPKISRPFRRARRARHGAAPIAIAQRRAGQDPTRVTLVVHSDPVGLVVGVRVVCWAPGGAQRTLSAPGPVRTGDGADREARFEVDLPAGVSRFTVAGLDEHGNRVVELGSEEQPLSLAIDAGPRRSPPEGEAAPPAPPPVVVDSAKEPPAEPARTPLYANWLLWGGVAVAVGAAGAWAGVTAQSAVDDLDEIRASEYEVEYSEAKRIADRAETRSLVANICFGAAGASAIVSTILFVRSRRHRPADTAADTTAVAPVVGRDHIGVAATLRF